MKKVISIAMALVMCLSVMIVGSTTSVGAKTNMKPYQLCVKVDGQSVKSSYNVYQGKTYNLVYGMTSADGNFITFDKSSIGTFLKSSFTSTSDKTEKIKKTYKINILNKKKLLKSVSSQGAKNWLNYYINNSKEKGRLIFTITFYNHPLKCKSLGIKPVKNIFGFVKYYVATIQISTPVSSAYQTFIVDDPYDVTYSSFSRMGNINNKKTFTIYLASNYRKDARINLGLLYGDGKSKKFNIVKKNIELSKIKAKKTF